MLIIGTPQDIEERVKLLWEKVGKNGGFIISGGCNIPYDTKPENYRAMINAILKYGWYDKSLKPKPKPSPPAKVIQVKQGMLTPWEVKKAEIGDVLGDEELIRKPVSLLRGAGFEVIDLGVDVPAEAFAAKVKETGAKIVGLSALLNLTYPEMKNVIDNLALQGIREGVTVIIGGAPCNEQVREFVGADYYAPDAVAGVNICKSIFKC